MNLTIKAKLVWLLCSITFLVLLILLFIGGAHPAAGSLFVPPWDKAAHVVFYLTLYLLLKETLNVSSWIVAFLIMLVAILDEYHQISLPFRHAGWDDLVADFFGVFYGVVFRRALVTFQ